MSNQVIHQLTDEAYADLCWRASQYEDLKAKVEQIRAEIDKLPIYIAKFTDCTEIHICKDSVLEIIDKTIKEVNE